VFLNDWGYIDRYLIHPLVSGEGEYIPAGNLFDILSRYPHKQLSLGTMIGLGYTANATDTRDHLYAVLGLSSEPNRSVLIPDYAMSLSEVCGRFVKHVIDTEKNLDILAFDHSDQAPQIPSWAPNFTGANRRADVQWRPFRHNFHVSRRDGASHPQVCFSENLRSLTVQGYSVDTVATVDGPFMDIQALLYGGEKLLESLIHKAKLGLERAEQPITITEKTKDCLPAWTTLLVGHHREVDLPVSKVGPPRMSAWPLLELLEDLSRMPLPLRGDIEELNEITLLQSTYLDERVEEGVRGCMPRSTRTKIQERFPDELVHLELSLAQSLQNHCFFITTKGYIGVGPRCTRPGHIVTIFEGGNMCFVLADYRTDYGRLGEAYVNGIMSAELMRRLVEVKQFCLR